MNEQLSMFEPTGSEVLQIAEQKERDAVRMLKRSENLELRGWHRSALVEFRRAAQAWAEAEQMHMLAEFEAYGGVA